MESFDAQIVPSPVFFADAMLGRLARWLRMLGYDTAYDKVIADESLILRVLTEQRWLLTRDSYLVQRKVLRGRHTLIVSDHLQEQLQQLQSELHIKLDLSDKTASRCALCNNILKPIPHEKATSTVPAYVASLHPRFVQCPNCERIYWPGTHWTHYVHSPSRTESLMRVGYLPLILFLILLALLPLVFGQLFTTAVMKLRLDPSTAILLVIGIILGGAINIPLKRIARNDTLVEDPLAILGLTGRWPRFQRVRQGTIIAVNVGGCLIPAGLVIGADLLHLRDIETLETGIASIGGAGTFDGIVLSGIVSAYLV